MPRAKQKQKYWRILEYSFLAKLNTGNVNSVRISRIQMSEILPRLLKHLEFKEMGGINTPLVCEVLGLIKSFSYHRTKLHTQVKCMTK